MSGLNESAIIASFIERSLPAIVEILYEKGKFTYQSNQFRNQVHDYLAEIYRKNIMSKSYFFQDEPQYFYDFFIPLDVNVGNDTFYSLSFSDVNSISNLIIIEGLAGGGKTLLLRHLFIESIVHGNQIPVFLELREYNTSEKKFAGWILDKVNNLSSIISEEMSETLMKEEKITLFLDGYDEVMHEKRANVSNTIKDLSNYYPNLKIILSSRPDESFQGWQGFTKLKIRGLSDDKSIQLLEKLNYDDEVKLNFVEELKNRLFASHKSFTTNPLLLTIMLVTYGQYADIPNKRSLFYNQAFEALYQKHDAAKGPFKRALLSKLDIVDFSIIFSLFSLHTYAKRKFKFSYTDAIQYIKSAASSAGVKVVSEHILLDAKQGVNLIIQDGVDLAYSHRSFQEFFVAKYIADCPPKIARTLLKKFANYTRSDEVFELVCEMNLDRFEECVIIPTFQKFFNRIGLKDIATEEALLLYLNTYWSEVGIDDVPVGLTDSGDDEFKPTIILGRQEKFFAEIEIVLWCYRKFGWNTDREYDGLEDEEFIKKYYKNEFFDKGEGRVFWCTDEFDLNHTVFKDLVNSGGITSVAFLNGARSFLQDVSIKKKQLEYDIESLLKG